MSNKSAEQRPIRQAVLDRNTFVRVPRNLALDQKLNGYLETLPKKFIDLDKVLSVLCVVILEDPKGWKPINPDIQLLEAADEAEVRRVSIEISKRKSQMQAALKNEVSFGRVGNQTRMMFRGEMIERNNGILIEMLRQSRVTQDLIWGWVRSFADAEGGILAIGEDFDRVSKKSFAVFDATNINENGALDGAWDTFSRSVMIKLAREASKSMRLDNEQKGIEVPRTEFVWASNPLISGFRTAARPIVLQHLEDYKKVGVTEFDLVTQVMMHLAIYNPSQVWLGDHQVVHQVVQLIETERGDEAEQLFSESLQSGRVWINEELAHYECERQAIKLADHYAHLSVSVDDAEVALPAQYMGDPERSPFKEFERTEVSAKERQYETDPITGEKIMIAVEKYSGKRIFFKSVRPEISYLYSVGFSNLHYPRSGETYVFGAYLEGDVLPFAYSSYTPVVRAYSRDMLSHIGVNPANVMESARAWNSSWAPENTMSLLFSFAHEIMREDRSVQIESGTQEDPLEGVFTSINPNLGFKAVSFRGVRFNVGGVKPTGFSYLRNAEGSADFMPKGEIKKRLGVETDDELQDHPDFVSNAIPFLPTVEMVTLFDIEDEKRLLEKPVYRVTPDAFNRG